WREHTTQGLQRAIKVGQVLLGQGEGKEVLHCSVLTFHLRARQCQNGWAGRSMLRRIPCGRLPQADTSAMERRGVSQRWLQHATSSTKCQLALAAKAARW